MKTMDHVKKRIIISMMAILLLIITLFGITYAYFVSRFQGNTSDSVSVSAGILALKYGDGNALITAKKIIPNTVIEEKTFTVTNTGTRIVDSYEVIVEKVYNDLEYYEDLTYELTCKSYKTTDYEENGDNVTETGSCNGSNGIFPKTDDYLVRNSIDKGITHAYVLTLTYNETNEDQSKDMNKTIEAKVNIIDDETNYKSVLVYGNSVQDGTPTPSLTSPVEINGVGDKTKNLWSSKLSKGALTFANGSFYDSNTYVYNTTKIPVEEGETYTLSADGYASDGSAGFVFFKDDIFVSSLSTTSMTVTIPYGVNQLVYNFHKDGGIDINSISNIQLEKNNDATSYEPYGKYKIPITVSGKNLFDEKNIKVQFGKMQPLYENDYVLISHPSTSTYSGTYVKIPINAKYLLGKTITVSYDFMTSSESNTMLRVGYEDINAQLWKDISAAKNISSVKEFSKHSLTVTLPNSIPEDMKGENFLIALYSNSTGQLTDVSNNWVRYKNIQVEINNVATTYESYYEPETYNIILDEPLRKVGDCDTCADYIDLYNGKVYRNVKYVEFDENSNWSVYSSVANHFQVPVGDNYFNINDNYVLSNYYPNVKSGKNYYTSTNYGVLSVDGNRIRFKNKDYTTLDEWKDHVSKLNDKIKVIYKMNKTDYETLDTDITRINKNSLITVDTNVQPSKIETEY